MVFDCEGIVLWKYSSDNSDYDITMHDCYATNINVEGNDLVIDFEDGFWVFPTNKVDFDGKAMRTGTSRVIFYDFEMFGEVYLYKTFRLFGKEVLTIRKKVSLNDLSHKVNSGKWKMEFVEEFCDKRTALLGGYMDKKNIRSEMEWQFTLDYFSGMKYYWNEIHTDRVW